MVRDFMKSIVKFFLHCKILPKYLSDRAKSNLLKSTQIGYWVAFFPTIPYRNSFRSLSRALKPYCPRPALKTPSIFRNPWKFFFSIVRLWLNPILVYHLHLTSRQTLQINHCYASYPYLFALSFTLNKLGHGSIVTVTLPLIRVSPYCHTLVEISQARSASVREGC